LSKKNRQKGHYREPETLFDTHRPVGPPQPREYSSQIPQLKSEVRHGTRKDAKRQMSYKTGTGEWDEKERLVRAKQAGRPEAERVLAEDKDLRGYGLTAEVAGGKVIVTGTVDTLAEKQRAEELLNRIPGVRGLESGIAISTDGRIRDEQIAEEVRQELANTPGVDPRRIGAEVHGGTAVLVGSAESREEEEAPRRAAAKARGVRQVVSRLRRRDKTEDLEEIFHSQVANDREEV
jgi:hyperosmotically inducible protein